MSGGHLSGSFGLNGFEQGDFARPNATAVLQVETNGQVPYF
jgi:hypothetical protein